MTTWRASWGYCLGPVVIAAVLLIAAPQGVAVHAGWLAGGASAAVIVIAGVAMCWALRRMYLSIDEQHLVVQNLLYRVVIRRPAVLGVAAGRSAVTIWFRDDDGIAQVSAAGAQGMMAGYFSSSRLAQIAAELQQRCGVGEPNEWTRMMAREE